MIRELVLVGLVSVLGTVGAAFCGCDLPVAAVVGASLAVPFGLKETSPLA